MKNKLPQETELANGIVWNLSRPGSFLAENTHPHMSFHDHVGVICAIPNSKSDLSQ